MFSVTSALLILSTLIPALAAPHAHAHSHEERNPASLKIRNWHQDPSSASAQLFKRAPPSATPGSAEWQAAYPAPGSTPPTSSIPQAWLDRLAQVVASPGFPTFGPTQPNNGYPTYSDGKKGTDDDVCSFTYECVEEWDVVSAPDGVIGLNFDDGPTTFSPQLYDFIEQHNISATHFMIGGNIYYNSATFQRAVKDGGHIAVHTWSHPYMTTLTNEQIVAELGWTAQIASDLMDGRVPAFWRPPYGDADNRVRYIAMEVFGMRTVPWNHDTGDWGIPSVAGYTHESVVKEFTSWLTDPSNRKGIIALEHEASQADIDVFMTMYPIMIQNNWTVMNVAEANNMWDYVNSKDDNAAINGMTNILQTAAPGALTTYINNHGNAVAGSATTSGSPSSASSAVSSSISSAASSAASSSAAGSSAAAQSTGSRAATPSANTAAASSPTSSTGAGSISSPVVGFAGSLLGLGLALLV